MILVDSSVWIDFLNVSPGAGGQELRRIISASEGIAVTGLVICEVMQGLTRNIAEVELFLSKWKVLEPSGVATYVRAAGLFRLARGKGLSITTIDSIIAAIALEHGASVFTLDSDFQRIASLSGLKLHKVMLT